MSPPSDARIYEILDGLAALQAVVVAQEIGLFELLARAPATDAEIGRGLRLSRRGARALLTVCACLDLIQVRDRRYLLTPLSARYLLKESPNSYVSLFEFVRDHSSVYTLENMRAALLSGSQTDVEGTRWPERLLKDPAVAERFVQAMHEHSRMPAAVWPRRIDLSGHSRLLDIGGGSGVHACEAAIAYPRLEVTLFDLDPVCRIAGEEIRRRELQERVRVRSGDFWRDPLPEADVHLYSDVFHDWAPEDCRALAAKSFAALSPGGRILIHEMLLDDDLAGPFAVAASSVSMLLWSAGQQFSAAELEALLASAGFVETTTIPTCSCWGIVTGRKP